MIRRYIGLREIAVDFVHVHKAVVRDVGFGQQDVHVAGHASGYGVDGEADVDSTLGERVEEFADFVLGLGHGHAVAGDDDDFVGGGENGRGFFGCGAADWLGFLLRRAAVCDLAEAAEQNVGERAVHRLAT